MLKNVLFRSGLTAETLDTLLAGEGVAHNAPKTFGSQSTSWKEAFVRPSGVPVTISRPHIEDSPSTSDNTAVGEGVVQRRRQSQAYDRVHSYGQPDSSDMSEKEEEEGHGLTHRVPMHEKHTVLVTNLSDRTTHKDLANIVRGGRVLDIFLRNDRSATISFVEGAGRFSEIPPCAVYHGVCRS